MLAGISTFRNETLVGSGITLSPDGDIFTTGVTTSTTFVGNLTGNVTGDASGNAGTATKLATARTIAGVSFDGSSNISLIIMRLLTCGYITASGTAANTLAVAAKV